MILKCGIIGLPNVGKSTLFNILTKSNSEVANFPFCTIKPNIALVSVMDERVNILRKMIDPKKITYACIEFVDIAGLVEGASRGEGLGNQFLSNIREADAILHVVRCFWDDNIIHVKNTVAPLKDLDIINTELILSDYEMCKKHLLQLQKKNFSHDHNIDKKIYILKKCFHHLKKCCMLDTLCLNKDEKNTISYLRFLTLKPMMYIANINETKESQFLLEELYKISEKKKSIVIPIFARLELDLVNMNKDDQKDFMCVLKIKKLSIKKIINETYKLLNLITFFTVGKKEIRSWEILNGSTSLQAAHKIHSDFSKGFIRVQVIKYIDFIKYKNEKNVKEAGKFKTEGKTYRIEDGDIVRFLFNV